MWKRLRLPHKTPSLFGSQPDLPRLLVRQITNVFVIFHLFYTVAFHDLDHVRRIHPDVRASWEERNGRQGHRYFYGGREDESSCGKAAAQGTLKESAAGLVHSSVPEVTTCWSLIRRTLQHWRLHKANLNHPPPRWRLSILIHVKCSTCAFAADA